MKDLKTIFYICGTSGAGKSTRIHSLIRFLEDSGYRASGYLTCGDCCVGREYLNSFYIVGKEFTQNGRTAWQGMDLYIDQLGGKVGSPQLFSFIYETARRQNIVLDSASILRTNRSRPLALEKYGVDAKTYSRFYWFDTFEEYQARIAGRANGKTMLESSPMWKTNFTLKRHGELQAEEEKLLKYPERYEFFHGEPSEPVWTIGVDILTRLNFKDLIVPYKEYAEQFLKESKNIVQVVSEDLF